MWRCPVCHTENSLQTLCKGCGFDHSMNMLQYPTLSPWTWELEQFRPIQRKRWGSALREAMACPACGGMTFHVLLKEKALVCAFCGAGLMQSAPGTGGFLCENGHIRPGKAPGRQWSEEEADALRSLLFTFTDPARDPRTSPGGERKGILGDLMASPDLFSEMLPMLQEGAELVCGQLHIAALWEDGTVSARGLDINGCCNVADWVGVCSIAAASFFTFGLTTEGRVLAAGNLPTERRQELEQWNHIQAIAAGDFFLAGLQEDGTLRLLNTQSPLRDAVSGMQAKRCVQQVLRWSHITAISAGSDHLLGLREDSTVLSAGSNGYHRTNTLSWHDVTAVAAGYNFSAALTRSGAVLCTRPSVELEGWKRSLKA